jgi:hypothetical protein
MMDRLFEMESAPCASGSGWGRWGLGDLADVSRWAAEILGSATLVRRLSLEPPSDQLGTPRVIAVVHDEQTVALLAERVMAQEQFPPLRGDRFGGGWFAELDGVELHVQPEAEAWR